jgi:hypothetical protein
VIGWVPASAARSRSGAGVYSSMAPFCPMAHFACRPIDRGRPITNSFGVEPARYRTDQPVHSSHYGCPDGRPQVRCSVHVDRRIPVAPSGEFDAACAAVVAGVQGFDRFGSALRDQRRSSRSD